MLRFRLKQVHVESSGRFFLPLPKLGGPQLEILADHLRAKSFRVSLKSGKMVAVGGEKRIAVNGPLGIASSSSDMLDALAPAIPALLDSRAPHQGKLDVMPSYASFKRSPGGVEVQFFPRIESSTTWTSLRREGLCGLTPDEAAVVMAIAERVRRGSTVECVTETPSIGSRPLQVGRRVYYRSAVPIAEFARGLRTTEEWTDKGCYLPRDSVLRLPRFESPRLDQEVVGDWCRL